MPHRRRRRNDRRTRVVGRRRLGRPVGAQGHGRPGQAWHHHAGRPVRCRLCGLLRQRRRLRRQADEAAGERDQGGSRGGHRPACPKAASASRWTLPSPSRASARPKWTGRSWWRRPIRSARLQYYARQHRGYSLKAIAAERRIPARQIRRTKKESMVTSLFATLIFDEVVGLARLSGVLVGITPRAMMRVAPDDPKKPLGFKGRIFMPELFVRPVSRLRHPNFQRAKIRWVKQGYSGPAESAGQAGSLAGPGVEGGVK